MALIKKKGIVQYYCFYCGTVMELHIHGIAEWNTFEYYMKCENCGAIGPSFKEDEESDKDACIEKVFNSMKPKGATGYKILTCGECAKDCVGFDGDVHKACPYPDCDGIVHEIPECARMP